MITPFVSLLNIIKREKSGREANEADISAAVGEQRSWA